MTLTGAEPATVTARLGKAKLAEATTSKSGALALKLSQSAVGKLAKKKKAKVKLDAAVDFGSPAKASGLLK